MLATLACALAASGQTARAEFRSEASRITYLTTKTFFDWKANIWRPTVASTEAVGTQGYTYWPSLVAWQAVIEAAKVNRSKWKAEVDRLYVVLDQYFDRGAHAYCAWKYFPGNDDHFYDDNGWAVIACMEAYEVTREARYRARAVDVLDGFLKGGWDGSGHPGGVRWGTKALQDRSDRTVSATASCALGALLVAKVHEPKANRTWAKKLLDWIRDDLSAPSGLIYDGFRSPTFERMTTIWTYNTGVPIRAALEYFDQTGARPYLQWAIRMGDASIDRSLSPLYDGAVKDPSKRYWFDGIYFVHYLVDGLRLLSRRTGNPKYLGEAERNARYCMQFLRDGDGLYWRNMRLWTIDEQTIAEFRQFTGQTAQQLHADASERAMDPSAMRLPVEQRPMVKTLLANASAARMFWLLSES